MAIEAGVKCLRKGVAKGCMSPAQVRKLISRCSHKSSRSAPAKRKSSKRKSSSKKRRRSYPGNARKATHCSVPCYKAKKGKRTICKSKKTKKQVKCHAKVAGKRKTTSRAKKRPVAPGRHRVKKGKSTICVSNKTGRKVKCHPKKGGKKK